MNKLITLLRTQGILILFGFVITISLFLGDGKQPLIDVVWAVEILLLYAIYHLQNRKIRALPRTIHTAWAMLLGYCVARTFFSDSVGYSISAIVRLFDAYLVYRLFYSLADKKRTQHAGFLVIIICAVATIVSFGCLLFPQLIQSFPQMNLLYATYGHNQLAGLLLFGIPLVIGEGVSIPAWCKKTILFLFLSCMVFSFARGAWILLAAYFAFLLLTKRLAGKFNTSITIVFIGVAAGLLVTMFLLAPRFAHAPPIMNNNWLYKQTIKPPIYESRARYWLQAASAIWERPMFGSGPGTFFLQSKRLQTAPLSYSWFAHSFVLEQLVELGLVGAVLWAILLIVQGRLLIRLRDHALLVGVILTFLYSLFEYNLNFLVIWLLFWATLGWLTGSTQLKKTSLSKPSLLVMGGIVLLFVFSLFSIGGAVEAAANNIDAASLFTPFAADVVETSIENHGETATPIPQKHLSLLLFFHKKNPEVLAALARKYEYAKNNALALTYYELSNNLDPLNEEYFISLEKFYLRNGEYWRFFNEYKANLIKKYPDWNFSSLIKVVFSDKDVDSDKREVLNSQIRVQSLSSEGAAIEEASINLFFLGYGLVKTRPDETKQLFIIARNLSPTWSYFHLALSSYYYYFENQKELARNVLNNCLQFEYAGDHCADVIKLSIPTLDEIKDYVITIP